VAAVQHVEAPVREHDPVTCPAMPGKAPRQEVNGPGRLNSPVCELHVSRTTLASLMRGDTRLSARQTAGADACVPARL
jgi:hypothetical protein